MPFQASSPDRDRLDSAAAHVRDRAQSGGGFVDDVAALPGDEHAARDQQREGELDQLIEVADGPDDHNRPSLTMVRIASEILGSRVGHADARGEAGSRDGGYQKRGLLADRFDEDGSRYGDDGRQWDARKAAATAEVEEGVDLRPADAPPQEKWHGRQAVDHVPNRDGRRVPNRGQVDRRIPGEQQADVVADDPAGLKGQVQAEIAQARIEGVIKSDRKRWKGLNARRERFPRTVQAPLLLVVPLGAVREPLPASSFVAPPVGPRSSVTCPVRGRVSPCPSQVSVPE